MPIHQYQCPNGHTQEEFFKTFSAAEEAGVVSVCRVCSSESTRIVSAPLGFGLYGDGFYKSSATKRKARKL